MRTLKELRAARDAAIIAVREATAERDAILAARDAEICAMRRDGRSVKEIARHANIHHTRVSAIIRRDAPGLIGMFYVRTVPTAEYLAAE